MHLVYLRRGHPVSSQRTVNSGYGNRVYFERFHCPPGYIMEYLSQAPSLFAKIQPLALDWKTFLFGLQLLVYFEPQQTTTTNKQWKVMRKYALTYHRRMCIESISSWEMDFLQVYPHDGSLSCPDSLLKWNGSNWDALTVHARSMTEHIFNKHGSYFIWNVLSFSPYISSPTSCPRLNHFCNDSFL